MKFDHPESCQPSNSTLLYAWPLSLDRTLTSSDRGNTEPYNGECSHQEQDNLYPREELYVHFVNGIRATAFQISRKSHKGCNSEDQGDEIQQPSTSKQVSLLHLPSEEQYSDSLVRNAAQNVLRKRDS